MLAEHEVQIGGKAHAVVFNARARYLFEKLSNYPLTQARVLGGVLGDVELAHLLTAGFEGARVRERTRRAPWTVDEVLDGVLAEATPDERLSAFSACSLAIGEAYKPAEPEAATSPEGKAPTGA